MNTPTSQVKTATTPREAELLVDPDPLRAAQALADERHAVLVQGSIAAEDAVRQLLSARPVAPSQVAEAERLTAGLAGSDADRDRELTDELVALRAAARQRPRRPEDVDRLRALSDQLHQLSAVRRETEARAAVELAECLGAPIQPSVSPTEARAAAPPGIAGKALLDQPRAGSQRTTDLSSDLRPQRRTRALAIETLVAGAALGGAAFIVVVGLSPLLAILALLAAAAVVLLVERQSRRSITANAEDRRAALDTLARAAAGAEAGRAGTASALGRSPLVGERATEAMVDPTAVKEVLAVRAAERAQRQARADWRVHWARLGLATPEAGSAEAELALSKIANVVHSDSAIVDLDAPSRLAEAEAASARQRTRLQLAGLLGTRTLDQLRAAPTESDHPVRLVLVEPFADLGPRRAAVLRRQLRELPDPASVCVVVSSPTHLPDA